MQLGSVAVRFIETPPAEPLASRDLQISRGPYGAPNYRSATAFVDILAGSASTLFIFKRLGRHTWPLDHESDDCSCDSCRCPGDHGRNNQMQRLSPHCQTTRRPNHGESCRRCCQSSWLPTSISPIRRKSGGASLPSAFRRIDRVLDRVAKPDSPVLPVYRKAAAGCYFASSWTCSKVRKVPEEGRTVNLTMVFLP
jgi:hypothetical protein